MDAYYRIGALMIYGLGLKLKTLYYIRAIGLYVLTTNISRVTTKILRIIMKKNSKKLTTIRKRLDAHTKRLVSRYGIMNLTLDKLCASVGILPHSFKRYAECGFIEYVTVLQQKHDYGVSHTTHNRRVAPVLRKKQILMAAVDLAEKCGYNSIKRRDVGGLLKVAPALVNAYFNDLTALREEVLQYAIDNDNLKIIAQAIVAKDPLTRNLSSKVRKRAVLSFIKN